MTLTLQLPPIPPPESNMVPGMAAPLPAIVLLGPALTATDTGGPGPFALQEPAAWSYAIEAPTGPSQATYPGDVAITGTLAAGNLPIAVTGSGAMVLQTAPTINGGTITGPTITGPTITGTIAGAPTISGPTITGPTISGPNIIGTISGGPTIAAPTITGPTITGTIGGTPAITGVANATLAAAGMIGQVISATVASGAPVTMPNGAQTTIVTLPLQAGDYDVWANGVFTSSAGVFSNVQAVISQTTNAAPPSPGGGLATFVTSTPTVTSISLTTASVPIQLAAPASVFLVGFAGFASGTASAYGTIYARRRH